jgi:hypothetical protein
MAILIIQSVKFGYFQSDIVGLFLYTAAWFIAFYKGFFKRKRALKIILVVILYIPVILLQLLRSPESFLIELSSGIIFIGIVIFFYLLFSKGASYVPKNEEKQDIDAFFRVKGKNLDLSSSGLSYEKICIIYGEHNDLKYKEIAKRAHKSIAWVKANAPIVYKKFNKETAHEFKVWLSKFEDILYPNGFMAKLNHKPVI